MIVRSIRVQNFRCIKDETLPCDSLTVLVGANGSGKSAFLRALEMFYEPAARYEVEDFYGGDIAGPIVLTVTYADLTDEEKAAFAKYIENDELTVQKQMHWPSVRGSQKYYGMSLRNPEFAAFRGATTAADRRAAYTQVRESDKYAALPGWTNQDAGGRALEEWEQANPQHCVRERDDGQFFGFKEVGQARLERRTRFLFIPAVLDASQEASERKGAALCDLLDLVVRSVLSRREDVRQLQADTQKSYDQIMNTDNLPELQELASGLNKTLKTYAPDAGIELPWRAADPIEIPLPRADPKLVEDEYSTAVQRAGHGLQRAFLLTLLQHLAIAEAPVAPDDEGNEGQAVDRSGMGAPAVATVEALMTPDLILGIEEPELYQHPNRQRHLSAILLRLATGSIEGVAKRTQVIYATHSPLFVDVSRTDHIRVLRKVPGEDGQPRRTKVSFTSLAQAASVVEQADGKPPGTYSATTLEPRLVALMTPWMNEAFFAHVAVLVEGEQDRAAILGVASRKAHDFDSLGISVIPCNGKTNLDRPAAIFGALDIPVYVIWDSDQGAEHPNPEVNRRLLRLLGQEPEDWPEKVCNTFACFRQSLDRTLRSEIGPELFAELLEEAKEHFQFDRDYRALKCPRVIDRILEGAQTKGQTSPTLDDIVSKIVALK